MVRYLIRRYKRVVSVAVPVVDDATHPVATRRSERRRDQTRTTTLSKYWDDPQASWAAYNQIGITVSSPELLPARCHPPLSIQPHTAASVPIQILTSLYFQPWAPLGFTLLAHTNRPPPCTPPSLWTIFEVQVGV